MAKRLVWIGNANVRPQSGHDDVLRGAAGAWVNVVGQAYDESEFRLRINDAADEIGLSVLSIKDMEPFRQRAANYYVDPQLHDLAEESEESGTTEFSTFHTYPEETDLN